MPAEEKGNSTLFLIHSLSFGLSFCLSVDLCVLESIWWSVLASFFLTLESRSLHSTRIPCKLFLWRLGGVLLYPDPKPNTPEIFLSPSSASSPFHFRPYIFNVYGRRASRTLFMVPSRLIWCHKRDISKTINICPQKFKRPKMVVRVNACNFSGSSVAYRVCV